MATPIKSRAEMTGFDDKSPVAPEAQPTVIQDSPQKPLEQKAAPQALTPEERAQRKARLAVVLERGVVSDRLNVELPAHIHGEWVRNDELEVQRLRTLGFEIDYDYAPKRGLHSDGTGAAVVADVIFMTTSRENKELIDEIREEQMMRLHNPKKSIEEEQVETGIRTETGGVIPAWTESSQRELRKEGIAAAIEEADNQIKPVTR